MLNRPSVQGGVSLIELIISVVILAILAAAGAPSFAQFIQNRKVRTGAEGVIQGLNLAKAEAVRRNTSIQIAIAADTGWVVGCTTAVADNDGDGQPDCPGNIQTRPANEGSSGVRSTAITLTFNGYGKIPALAASSNIEIDNPTAGTCEASGGNLRCMRIVVSPAGQVRSCDPQMTTSNPGSPLAC